MKFVKILTIAAATAGVMLGASCCSKPAPIEPTTIIEVDIVK